MVDTAEMAERVGQMDRSRSKVLKSDFSLSEGVSGEESVVAEFQSPQAIALRTDKPMRLAVPAVESYTTDGSTGNQETISLANDLIETPNTEDVVLYDEDQGQYVQPDSIDYDADEVTFTDNGSTNYEVKVAYMASNPGTIKILKQAPQSQGRVEEVIFDDVSELINYTDQDSSPITLDLNQSTLQRVVPEKYSIKVEVDLPYSASFDWRNGVLEVPAEYLDGDTSGLKQAVAQDIIERA